MRLSVCVSHLMLRDRCCLNRTSLPSNPNYPHHPLAGEIARFIACLVVAKCSNSPDCLNTQGSQPLLSFEIIIHINSLCVSTHCSLLDTLSCFPLVAGEDHFKSCFFHRKKLIDVYKRLQVCLCFYSESFLELIDLPSL